MRIFGYYFTVEQIGFICLCAILLILFSMIRQNYLDGITTFTSSEMKKVNQVVSKMNYQRERKFETSSRNRKLINRSKFFIKLKVFSFSDEIKEEYRELIDRLGETDESGNRRIPESYYLESCYNVLLLIGISIAFSVLGKAMNFSLLNLVSLGALAVIPYGYRMPINSLRKKKRQTVKLIDIDMIEFINMFYYRFSDENIELRLDDLIDSFIPLANDEMRRLLRRFELDTRQLGDVSALRILQKKYGDSKYIASFCTVALGVLQKQPNAYVQLSNLFDRLNSVSRLRYKKICEVKHEKKKKAYNIILGIFCLEMLLLVVFQIGFIN